MIKKDITLLAVIFLAAFFARYAFIILTPDGIVYKDSIFYNVLAKNLLTEKNFHAPMGEYSQELRSIREPAYPAFIAAIYLAAGLDNFYAVRSAQAFLGALAVILLFFAARPLFGALAAYLACAVYALYPTGVYYSGILMKEALQGFLLLAAVLFLILSAGKSKDPLWLFLSGAFIGISELCKSILIPAYPFFLLWIFFSKKEKRVSRSLIFLLGLLVIVTPWIVRNYMVHGKLMYISTGGGLAFWWENHPGARIGGGFEYPSEVGMDISKEQILALSETEWDALYKKLAFDYIKDNKRKFIRDSLVRLSDFWRLYPRKNLDQVGNLVNYRESSGLNKIQLISLFSFGPLLVLFLISLYTEREVYKKYYFLLFIIISYSALYSAFVTRTRYRLPIEPLLIMFAAGVAVRSLNYFKQKKERSSGNSPEAGVGSQGSGNN